MSSETLSLEIMEIIPAVMKTLRTEMRRQAAPDLTVAHFRTLAKMAKAPQTNKELADWIGIAPSSMCRTVDNLVKRGLAKRLTSDKDRREVRIVATAKGSARVEKVRQATRQMLTKFLNRTDTQTRTKIAEGLSSLKDILEL